MYWGVGHNILAFSSLLQVTFSRSELVDTSYHCTNSPFEPTHSVPIGRHLMQQLEGFGDVDDLTSNGSLVSRRGFQQIPMYSMIMHFTSSVVTMMPPDDTNVLWFAIQGSSLFAIRWLYYCMQHILRLSETTFASNNGSSLVYTVTCSTRRFWLKSGGPLYGLLCWCLCTSNKQASACLSLPKGYYVLIGCLTSYQCRPNQVLWAADQYKRSAHPRNAKDWCGYHRYDCSLCYEWPKADVIGYVPGPA